MNRKSNFLLFVSQDEMESGTGRASVLPNYYNTKIGSSYISLNYSQNTVFVKSSDDNIIILLSGNIYQDDMFNDSVGKYLINSYLLRKKYFVKDLNGSFCVFFAQKDSGEIYLATDRLNTRKIFKFEKREKLIFSTDINSLPLNECKLSYAGAASYLINGIMLNDLTIFDEIKKLDRSSLYKIINSKIVCEKYWDYNFTNEYKNRAETELADELHQLYLKSLDKVVNNKKNIFISLSGGYDSRGIAAMVKNISDNNSEVMCISHNFGKDNRNTDSDIAGQIAQNLNFPFSLLDSYNGDLFHTFKNNAGLGNGMASFCIELDAWEQINKDFEESENSILLVGDMYDGTYVEFHGNIKRALEKAHICEPSFLKEFKKYIKPEVYRNLYLGWENEYNKIKKKISVHNNMVNLLDFLYMDQLIPNLYSIARECFQVPFIETVSPFYDNDVLDFIQKIPPNLRDRKKLHKMTLETYYPNIFRIKFPSEGWGNEPVWINKIRSSSNIFIENINSHESRLDEVILPAAIIDAILSLNDKDTELYEGKTFLRSFHSTLNKILPSYHRIIESVPGGDELTRIAGKYINPRISHPLIKILILRLYLGRI